MRCNRSVNFQLCLLLILALIRASPAAPDVDVDGTVCDADFTGEGSCGAAEASESLPAEDALIEWIQSMEGGKVETEKFRIERKYVDGFNETTNNTISPEFEFYATRDISEGEVLMEIPESAMIGNFLSQEQDKFYSDYLKSSTDEEKFLIPMCIAIDQIANEHYKGEKSFFYPFLKFIYGIGNPKYKRPAEWTEIGQFIFWGMTGQSGTLFSPSHDGDYIKAHEVCRQYRTNRNSFSKLNPTDAEFNPANIVKKLSVLNRSYDYFARHSWGTMLIPLFDMIPHRNGKWKNVEARFVESTTGTDVPLKPRAQRFHGFVRKENEELSPPNTEMKLVVYAHRDISAGEPLRVSYNQCEHLGCEILRSNYATSNFLADTGLVEEYPRRWLMVLDQYEAHPGKGDFIFDIDIDPETGEKTFELINDVLDEDEIYKMPILSKGVERWKKLKVELDEHTAQYDLSSDRLKFEHNMLWGYYYAITESIILAWTNRYAKLNAPNQQNTIAGYDDFLQPSGVATNTVGRYMACAEGEQIDGGYLIGESQSFYQLLQFSYEEEIFNTYMKLNNWIHSASNFRAHYHESVIHVALQYVENPKRIAYIGGGDNMVVAEALKYPGIELVVGMELDQQVSRSSMKFFGTSPYFHDERVEWWYGNGANALQMIPDDYFGSFDLVLVDLLTDVAESIKVSVDMSLVDVAPLLMKPGGLLARNEDLPDRSDLNTRMAKRVVMYDYTDTPRLCAIHVNIASNSVDFFDGKRYNHGVKTVTRLKNFEKDQFTGWARFYDSSTGYEETIDPTTNQTETTKSEWTTFDPTVCKKIKNSIPAYNEKVTSSVGVLVVIEAENVTAALEPENLPEIHKMIIKVAENHGLSIVDSSHHPGSDVNAFLLILIEGYIKVQIYPDAHYVAFDLMLWGSNSVIDKSEEMKQDLVDSVGGGKIEGSVSSYKISTTGIELPEKDKKEENMSNRRDGKNSLVDKALEYYCEGADIMDSDIKIDSVNTVEHAEDNGNKDSKSEEKIHSPAQVEAFDPSIFINEISFGQYLIFCGKEVANDCANYISVAANTGTDGNEGLLEKSVYHPFYSCESFEDMESCELETTERLLGFTKEHKRLDGFVLDPSVSLEMGMVLHKVFNNTNLQPKIFEESFIALSPTDDGRSWRETFLDRFRTEMFVLSPLYKADFEISNHTHSEVWSVVSVRKINFLDTLSKALKVIEAKTSLVAVTRKILNSIVNLVMDWSPHNPKDDVFFNEEAMGQWFEQKPLASQYLIQMKVGSTRAPLVENERVLVGDIIMLDPVDTTDTFIYDFYEATVTKVLGDSYQILLTVPNEKIGKEQWIDRSKIRKFSKTAKDRLSDLDVGNLVLVKDPFSPTSWFAGHVKAVTQEGIQIRPKDPDAQDIRFFQPEDLLMYNESPEFTTSLGGFSSEEFQAAFHEAFTQAGHLENEDVITQNFRVGKAYLSTFVSSFGSGVMTWDGGDNVVVNGLISKEMLEEELDQNINDINKTILKALPILTIVAQDVFPRGYGKVVNFRHEMLRQTVDGEYVDYVPHWMNNFVSDELKMENFDDLYLVEVDYEEDILEGGEDIEIDEEGFDYLKNMVEEYENEWDDEYDDEEEDD